MVSQKRGELAAAVEVDNLTVAYGERVALADVSLAVPSGRLVAVIGPNGAGKSTLFRCLLGVLLPTRGQVRVLGRPPREVRQAIAYVPQHGSTASDFPMTVEEVVLLGSYRRVGWLHRPGRRERDRARQALAQVGLLDRAATLIGRLSGGQRQRVYVARALLQMDDGSAAPGVMVLDEPLAGVDATSSRIVLDLLRGVTAGGTTVLMSTHDLAVAADLADDVLLLNGRLTGFGPPADILTPEVLQATYGGSGALFAGPAMRVLDDPHHHVVAP